MEPVLYLSLSFNMIKASEAEKIIEEIVKIRGTRVGMGIHYEEPITGDDD